MNQKDGSGKKALLDADAIYAKGLAATKIGADLHAVKAGSTIGLLRSRYPPISKLGRPATGFLFGNSKGSSFIFGLY